MYAHATPEKAPKGKSSSTVQKADAPMQNAPGFAFGDARVHYSSEKLAQCGTLIYSKNFFKNNKIESEQVVQKNVIQRVEITVEGGKNGKCPTWNYGGKKYHLTTHAIEDFPHVTCEDTGEHYYWKGDNYDDAVGKGKKKNKRKFSGLPPAIQTLIKNHYTKIVNLKHKETQTFNI